VPASAGKCRASREHFHRIVRHRFHTDLTTVAVAAVGTAGFFSGADKTSLGNLSTWAFLLCFAGVG
jgi:hypothetical protein